MGLFISFEGPDGSGKTMQMNLLEKTLRQKGYEIVRTREPGGTQIAEQIRALLLDPQNKTMHPRTEALLYAAARAQHVEELIRPALAEGKIVLSDRFTDSSLVYQGIGRDLGVDNISGINAFATDGLQPDVTILIQLDFEEGLRRKRVQYQGQLDRMEQAGDAFHRMVHDGFNRLASIDPQRILVVNGGQSVEKVREDIWNLLEPYLSENF